MGTTDDEAVVGENATFPTSSSSSDYISRFTLLKRIPRREYVTVAVFLLINTLNYMDRFTIAGIPDDVMRFYRINNQELGLLQTVFFISYTVLSPLVGFLGDRWSRKCLMQIGLTLWITVTFASSFVPSDYFKAFLFTRSLVGVGEASFTTIAPTILTDLFFGTDRIKILGIFLFTVPFGSGLGYIIGSSVTRLTGNWQWSLRVTPPLGVVCILVLTFLHQDPPRGHAEGGDNLRATPWLIDLKCLILNKSFLLVSFGFTSVAFVLGALTWFSVDLIQLALSAKHDDPTAWRAYNVPLMFGISACLAGIFGVVGGAASGRALRIHTPIADTLLCSISLFLCAPVLFVTLLATSFNFYLCSVLIFVVQFFLSFCWALVADMTMSVVIPTRRSTASAFQMVLTHALGDAISPSIVGAISVAISDSTSLEMQYLSLQRALFITPFICVLGGLSFLWNSFHLVQAKKEVHLIIEATAHDAVEVESQEGSTDA